MSIFNEVPDGRGTIYFVGTLSEAMDHALDCSGKRVFIVACPLSQRERSRWRLGIRDEIMFGASASARPDGRELREFAATLHEERRQALLECLRDDRDTIRGEG